MKEFVTLYSLQENRFFSQEKFEVFSFRDKTAGAAGF